MLTATLSCSYYSFSGSLPGHIKTCAVPLFENETVEPDLVEDVTKVVVDAIIANGTMKVVGEFQADAVVNGTIVEFLDELDEFSGAGAKQLKIRVFANVKFFDKTKNKAIWEEEGIEGWGRYDSDGSEVTREDGKEKALEMLAKEIIDRTVSDW